MLDTLQKSVILLLETKLTDWVPGVLSGIVEMVCEVLWFYCKEVIMAERKSVLVVLVLVLGMTAIPAAAEVVLSENFQTYGESTWIDDSNCNLNGWADTTIPIVTEGTAGPGAAGTFDPCEGLKVTTINISGSTTKGTTPHPDYANPKVGTEASTASIATLLPTGTATLNMVHPEMAERRAFTFMIRAMEHTWAGIRTVQRFS